MASMAECLEGGPGDEAAAVLTSGGVESAVLVAQWALDRSAVTPIYIRCGLVWEDAELQSLERFLARVGTASLRPLRVFDVPIREVYGEHWSTDGKGTPDEATADEAVYLPGRNLLLLGPAALWCHLNGIGELAIGSLLHNPFPDATSTFFAEYEALLREGVGASLRIVRPFARLTKPEVLRRGADLPLHETFSCIRPVGSRHCGRCNKCAERRGAFRAAGIDDKTVYANHC